MTITAYIYNAYDEEIKIVGEYHKGQPGLRNQYGVPIEPDDLPEMELLYAWHVATDKYIDLEPDEEAQALTALWVELKNLN